MPVNNPLPLTLINNLDKETVRKALQQCCGSSRWLNTMLTYHPFASWEDLLSSADKVWEDLSQQDWLEAFSHHPKIGDINSLKTKFGNTWAGCEQSSTAAASTAILQELKEKNEAYEQKFGYIFIVCATGKSADEMLSLLNQRLANDPATELSIACAEQSKITKIRLKKLCQQVL